MPGTRRAAGGAGRSVQDPSRSVKEAGKEGTVPHGEGKAVTRASKHIDLGGSWQDESSSTHRHEHPEHATRTPSQILHDLESVDPQRRLAAYRRVADMGAEGTPFLRGLLTDERPKVRQWAAQTLAHLRSVESGSADATGPRPPAPPTATDAPAALPLPPRPETTAVVQVAEAVPVADEFPVPDAREPQAPAAPEAAAAPMAVASDIDGPALAERLLAFSRLSRLDLAYAEALAALQAHRRRFPMRAERAEPTRAFDAAPSLSHGTTLLGVVDGAEVPVAVRVPKDAAAEEGSLSGVVRIEAEFVGWDAIYDRAVFEGIRLD